MVKYVEQDREAQKCSYLNTNILWPSYDLHWRFFVGDRQFYCPHALANSNQSIWIRENMLKFTSNVLPIVQYNSIHIVAL